MALTRPALSAKVAQPKITPIATPGRKPQPTMIAAIASSDAYSRRASWRAPAISQRTIMSYPSVSSRPPSTHLGMTPMYSGWTNSAAADRPATTSPGTRAPRPRAKFMLVRVEVRLAT